MEMMVRVLQIALGLLFIASGIRKLVQLYVFKIQFRKYWLAQLSDETVKLISALQFTAGALLIGDVVFNYSPFLAFSGSVFIGLTLMFAAFIHLKKRANAPAAFNLVLLALTLFVAFYNANALIGLSAS